MGTALVNGEFTEEEAKGNESKQVQKILSKIQVNQELQQVEVENEIVG